MRHFKFLIFTIIFFIIFIPNVHASKIQPHTTSLDGGYSITAGYIYHHLIILSGTYVITPNDYLSLIIGGYISVPHNHQGGWKYHGVGVTVTFKLKSYSIKVSFVGSKTYTYSVSMQAVWYSDHVRLYFKDYNENGIITLANKHYNELSNSVYFWKITISLSYNVVFEGQTIATYSNTHSVVSIYNDVTIVNYKESGSWYTDVGNGLSISFSTLYTTWSAASNKITSLDWGDSLMSLNLLSFLGDIVNLFGIIGYAIFEMFIAPITTISYIASKTTVAFTVSMFLIGIVADFMIAYLIWKGFWKVISLIKP